VPNDNDLLRLCILLLGVKYRNCCEYLDVCIIFFAQNKLAGNSLTAITAEVLFGQLNLCLCVTTYKIINNSLRDYNACSRTT
jgi:hypothetical protein